MGERFTAGLVQMCSGTEPAANAAALREGVREAVAGGASYVQTPEMTGAVQSSSRRLRATLEAQDHDPVLAAAADLAAEHGIWLHIGSTAVAGAEDGRLWNRAHLFAPEGSLRATYDKLHMFDVDLDGGESWRESRLYEPGEETVVADAGPMRLGIAICYDLRFPELFAAQARAGANVLSVPAAFTAQTGRAHWETLVRARAIECGAFVLAAAQGGRHEDGRETWGHSIAVDPWGQVLGMLDHDEPGVLTVEIDLAASSRARAKVPNLSHAREFSLAILAAEEHQAEDEGREAAE